MFRSSTILRELVQSLVKVIYSEYQSAQQKTYTPFHDMLPHLHTIYDDVILLNVLTEV